MQYCEKYVSITTITTINWSKQYGLASIRFIEENNYLQSWLSADTGTTGLGYG